MRAAAALSVLALLGSAPAAQVFGIGLVDEKAERKFKQHLTTLPRGRYIVCEPHEGIEFDGTTIFYSPEVNEVFVADPEDPEFVPYRLEDGEKVPNGKKAVLRIPGQSIRSIVVLFPDQSLYGLTREYLRREAEIDALRDERDRAKKGTAEWSRAHARMMAAYGELSSWLARTCYTSAAEALDKQIAKESKKARGEAADARLDAALTSIRSVPTPEPLSAASQAITGGRVEFGVCESQHVRLYFDRAGMTDDLAMELLAFAEQAIDGFRRDLVDPWISESYPDHIPDHIFLELWIGPDDLEHHQRFYEDFFGERWPEDHLQERLRVRGATRRREEPPEFLDYGKREDHEPFGVVAHRVGHCLADLHYNANVPGMKQDWIGEAVGYHIAFEYLGRNEETCYAFKEEHRYAPRQVGDVDMGDVQILLGERYVYNRLALEKGRKIEQLAPLTIYEMADPDIAKAWSFYDFLVRNEGLAGQRFLRSACEHARSGEKTWLNAWREAAAEIYGTSPADVFAEADARWRAYAEREQRTTSTPRKGR